MNETFTQEVQEIMKFSSLQNQPKFIPFPCAVNQSPQIATLEFFSNCFILFDNNFDDENTIILCIQLTDGILFSNGTRFDIDFTRS